MKKTCCDIMLCDELARNYLPRMRAELVYRLVNGQGVRQSEVSRRLGISRAAISQYLSRKRGSGEIEVSDDMAAMLDRWAFAVMNEEQGNITICDICQCAKKGKR
ncbi:MAG: transcriptional regulator [Methanocalculus sp. MSAO_Arc1]|uniref:transcriptional regulator n=1 Tax=Methanocalculus TaxID=71151 RepID=UPI000FF4265F|nr:MULTISPECIES: transcriptional regulator [unclassified Methanocalculus]MCP1662917.1 putative transcriptional regulator [Methanocalculus sp. AMF5]RQD80375.1 MAG: transcriptional regulator [Methanocalculus sp. MSAO_Arc1]